MLARVSKRKREAAIEAARILQEQGRKIAEERDSLRAENARLRSELAAAYAALRWLRDNASILTANWRIPENHAEAFRRARPK